MNFFKTALVAIGVLVSVNVWALTYDSDVPKDLQNQMNQDLGFVAQVQGNGQTKFHQQIYGAVDGKSYKSFFESHIEEAGLDDCGDSLAVACVSPFYNPNKMWLTPNYTKFSHPQIARLMIVFHEARHAESDHGNWMHDTCPNPFKDETGKDKVSIWTGAKLAGQPACDSTPFGSYGSSTIMLKNVSKFCANCTDKVKMDADIYAMDQLGRIDRAEVKKAMLSDFDGN